MPLLDVQNLRTTFLTPTGPVHAVNGVSLTLNAGDAVGIVGESGSGKSVLNLSVMGLVPTPPAEIGADAILFEGEDLRTLSRDRLRRLRGNRIAMIFQDPMTSLNPFLKIGDQLTEPLLIHRRYGFRKAKDRILELLKEVGINEPTRVFDSYPHHLSGGMRQRAMIAMALACEPALLIADEPTTALDVTIQAQILDMMRQIRQKHGTAIVLITHDLGVAAGFCDRIYVMNAGKVVEEAATEALFTNPQHPYTQALLRSVPRLDDPIRQRFVTMSQAKSTAAVESESTPSGNEPTTDFEPILQVRDLHVDFTIRRGWGRPPAILKAVDGVSFDLGRGETLGLVGESGCGKSTTARAILRLVPMAHGSARLNYAEPGKPSHWVDLHTLRGESLRRARQHLQLVFQDPFASLNPRMTVGQIVAEPMKIFRLGRRAEIRDKVDHLFQEVGLDPAWQRRYPHEFSGGQRQRVGIARALALDPKVLICDEAVSALDVSIRAQVLNLLMDLQAKRGLSYLFISHDLSVVKRISHRVAVMYLGRILELAGSQQLYDDPRHAYTKSLMSAIPVPDPAIERNRQRVVYATEIPDSPEAIAAQQQRFAPLQEVAAGHWVSP